MSCGKNISALSLLAALASATVISSAQAQDGQSDARTVSSAQTAADTALAVHVLNRLAFGPRPGEVERVLSLGIDNWIDRQLRADTVLDSSALGALKGCNLFTEPVDIAMSRLNARETFDMVDSAGTLRSGGIGFGGVGVNTGDSARKIIGSPLRGLQLANNQLHACRLMRLESSESQLLEVMADFWSNHFSIDGFGLPNRAAFIEYDRVAIRPNALGTFRELLGVVARTPAMLDYLDNAVNSADSTRRSLLPYVAPAVPFALGPLQRPGLNENYARELLELHTMGSDGGYSQQDVIEVARAFTGWSHSGALPGGDEVVQMRNMMVRWILSPRPVYLEFQFDASRHDAEEKTVLGVTLPARRGIEDGEEVLDILAKHPSTARHISRKLCVRFVSDSPPESLVARVADTFTRTDGNIREVLRTIFTSPEFRSPSVHAVKVKSPLEFVLSMRRTFGAPPDVWADLVDFLVMLNQPPFGRESPDGWPETGAEWMTVGAMSTRVDISSRIGRGEFQSIPLDNWPEWRTLSTSSFDAQVSGVTRSILNGRISATTRAAFEELRPPAGAPSGETERRATLRKLIAMALSSPEFQKR